MNAEVETKIAGYPEIISQAVENVLTAEENLKDALKSHFPFGSEVSILRPPQPFQATVVGWNTDSCTVEVHNPMTNKYSRWGADRVKPVKGGAA